VKAWLTQHRQALAAALAKLARQKSASLLNALVIGVALALPAGGYLLLANLQGLARGIALEPQMSVYLRTDAGNADVAALDARLKADARVASVRFVSRDQALSELKELEGAADLIAALGQNPLPDAYVVRGRDAGALDALAAEARGWPGVAQVQLDAAWSRRLGALAGIARIALVLLAALLAAAMIAVTFNTIRLQILVQREEIDVSRLLGATDAFIRRPFFYLGALQGATGGAIALAIVKASVIALNRGVAELAATYGSGFQLAFFGLADSASALAFSVCLGWVGAYLSVSIYLHEMPQ